jgi:hypothetical protein
LVWAPRLNACDAHERRCGQRHRHHDNIPREQKRGRGQQLGQGPLHKG